MTTGVAFYIGVIPVSWYGIMLTVAAIVALTFAYLRWRKYNYSNYHWWLLVIPGILIAIFGARWWYLMFNPSDWDGMFSLFQIGGGRAIQGTIFFVFLWIFIYTTWIFPIMEFRRVASIIMPSILLAQSIGRWGNYYNQEIFGAAAETLWWLPEFIQEGMIVGGQQRQPLFLYESVVNLVGWFVIFFVFENVKSLKPGTQAATYLIWYNTTRAIMEPLRNPDFIMNISGFPTTYFMSFVFVAWGVSMFVYYQWFFEKAHIYIDNNLGDKIYNTRLKNSLRFKYLTKRITKENYTTILSVSIK